MLDGYTQTQCQLPIVDFEYMITTDITIQEEEWKLASHTYIQTNESFIVKLTVASGHPVEYGVDWQTDNATDNGVNDTAAEPSWHEFYFSYPIAGNYSVNMTAHNLHSEPVYGHVKYTHNFTQSLIVQVPVTEYTELAPESWINDLGRKSTKNRSFIK